MIENIDDRFNRLEATIAAQAVRIAVLETTIDKLNHRTIGSVRFGPRRKTDAEIAEQAERFGKEFEAMLKNLPLKKTFVEK